MTNFLAFTVVGIVTGGVFAVAASGLVVTYTTSGIFNFAHGAIGMVMAFLYWELKVNRGWPTWLALVVVLFVAAPLFGAAIERVLMRRLHGRSTGVSLVVTLGLLVLLLGAAQSIWPGTVARTVPNFFGTSHVKVFGVVISYHELSIIGLAALTALLLRLLLFQTRVGIAMRAVVDDRELSALNGALPERVSQLSWALGAMLAATAGILLAPSLTLNHLGLTLLVVNGYAAAMLGRLRSLPLTFVGALALGLAEAYLIGYGADLGIGSFRLTDLKATIPTIFLFAILVFLPQARLRAGRVTGTRAPRVPGRREAGVAGVAFVAVALLAAPLLSEFWLANLSGALVIAMVMLSLVLLTGYAGQVSLMQMAFVGVGALTMGKIGGGSVAGLVAAAVFAGALGAIVALPALRLQDLYLALATLAFALMAEWAFGRPWAFDEGGTLSVERLNLLGIRFESEASQLVLLAAAFTLTGLLVLAVRRGQFGRRLAAMKDSPTACATLGLNLLSTKTAVFALSAAMAGVAGALFGGLRTSVTENDFLMLQSLFVFLMATFGGITTVTGALLGGVALALLPVVQQEWFPGMATGTLQAVVIGAGAILISRYPDGFAGIFSQARERLRAPFLEGAAGAPMPPAPPEPEVVEVAA